MLTAWGVPAETKSPCEIVLEGYAAEARADVERKRDACVTMLALWDDTVIAPLVTSLSGAQTKRGGSKIVEQLKKHAKSLNQDPVRAFKQEIGKIKRYMTKHESKARQTQKQTELPQVSTELAVNPLWTIIHNLVEALGKDSGIGTRRRLAIVLVFWYLMQIAKASRKCSAGTST